MPNPPAAAGGDVYEFDAGEEAIEAAASRYSSRFLLARDKPPKLPSQPRAPARTDGNEGMTKRSFLIAFQSDKEHKNSNVSSAVHTPVLDFGNNRQSEAASPERKVELLDPEKGFYEDGLLSKKYHEHKSDSSDEFETLSAMEKVSSIFRRAIESLGGKGQQNDISSCEMALDSEDERCESSPKSSSTTHSVVSCDEVENDLAVIICPDYVTIGDSLYVQPKFTFSREIVMVVCSENDGSKALEWSISEIISIDCQCTRSLGPAFVSITVPSKSGNVMKVQFVTTGIQWPEAEKKILNLATRYLEIWNTIPSDILMADGCNNEILSFFPKHYISRNLETMQEVVYPENDPDAVSISKRDIELLLPETFINDTVIDFYIKYLSTKLLPTQKKNFHFFNSFFFRKLVDLDKERGKEILGRVAFQRVRKWTRKVNLFQKDFVFIPVNFNLHWSLVVICHPGEIISFQDANMMDLCRVPCILHLDSLRGSHDGLKNLIQGYLWEEWKERHSETSEDNAEKFFNLRFIYPEVPQQQNAYDCGLFLLHNVERFLEDVPDPFNPLTLCEYSYFLTPDWFPPAEASFKRSVIRKLIYDLIDVRDQRGNHGTEDLPVPNVFNTSTASGDVELGLRQPAPLLTNMDWVVDEVPVSATDDLGMPCTDGDAVQMYQRALSDCNTVFAVSDEGTICATTEQREQMRDPAVIDFFDLAEPEELQVPAHNVASSGHCDHLSQVSEDVKRELGPRQEQPECSNSTCVVTERVPSDSQVKDGQSASLSGRSEDVESESCVGKELLCKRTMEILEEIVHDTPERDVAGNERHLILSLNVCSDGEGTSDAAMVDAEAPETQDDEPKNASCLGAEKDDVIIYIDTDSAEKGVDTPLTAFRPVGVAPDAETREDKSKNASTSRADMEEVIYIDRCDDPLEEDREAIESIALSGVSLDATDDPECRVIEMVNSDEESGSDDETRAVEMKQKQRNSKRRKPVYGRKKRARRTT